MNVRFCTQLTFKRRRCKSCFSPMPASSLATCCMKQNSLRIFESSLKQNSSLAQSGLSAFGLWCSIPTCTSPTQPYIYIYMCNTDGMSDVYLLIYTQVSYNIINKSSQNHTNSICSGRSRLSDCFLWVFDRLTECCLMIF